MIELLNGRVAQWLEHCIHIAGVTGSNPVPSTMKLFWTEHSKIKMKQYGLSKQKLLGILYRPERKEKGIVPGTTAVMRTNKVFKKTISLLKEKTKPAFARDFGGRRVPGEIWIMYKDVKIDSVLTRKIISAWRYPGVSSR